MNRSETIGEVAKALCQFNNEITKISKDAKNPFYKNLYATLDNIINDIRPILSKHGLSILQMPSGNSENVIIKTMLLHESGEYIESEPLLMKPVKSDPQAVGSCITYARRYSLNSFLSLNTGEDDDGNRASQKGIEDERITTKQYAEIKTIWINKGYKPEDLALQIQKLYNKPYGLLTKTEALEFMNKLNKRSETNE